MAPWLPELVSDILQRLPVEPLMRFRCLSRSYCAEIDSAEFAKCQLKKSIQRKTGLKLFIHNADATDPTDFFVADVDGDLDSSYCRYNPLKSPRRNTLVLGSCNGLFLLGLIGDGVTKFAFWNPSTRLYKRLPLCPVETLPGYTRFASYGFGCDSALDDYKIVAIPEFGRSSNESSSQVWVFSLKSNSWKRIADLEVEDRIVTRVGWYANGALYWELESDIDMESESESESEMMKIVGFDLTKESFFDVPGCGPAAIGNTLVAIGGNLYAQISPNLITLDYYLLMRDKDGKISWRKEFTVESWKFVYQLIPPWPLAHSKNGDMILYNEANELFWFKFEGKTTHAVNIKYPIHEIPTWNFQVCQESLVSPGPDSAADEKAEEVIIEEDAEQEQEQDSYW